jgi:transcriptional regulator with XRE-family HTH domain
MQDINQKISTSLHDARKQAKLSLRQLASRAGTSHATLLAYEKGKKMPGTSTFFRILEACGHAVDIHLYPRIRDKDGIPRREELALVLELAEQFPHRASRHLNLKRFPNND